MSTLDVYLYGARVATLEFLAPQRYRLRYLEEWLNDPHRMPLSLSLPLAEQPITGQTLTSFLDNLLPDNADVRERWAVEAGLATVEPFDLLRVYGADVAGAVQFAEPNTDPALDADTRPITAEGIAARIRAIRDDDTNWLYPNSQSGNFSLGGAQGKFALGTTGEGWYEPSGKDPTTHIFKPRVRGQLDGEIVEFITMTVARAVGIAAAGVDLTRFEGEHSLVVERFDRVSMAAESDVDNGGETTTGLAPSLRPTIIRLHQEDLAQATGTSRLKKYEYRGGPTYRQILRLLERHVPDERKTESVGGFVRALVFSWMVLNTDAHAKNYSIFIGPDGVDLTPLYDVSSFIPYAGRPDDDHRAYGRTFRSTQLSMRIAADYEAGAQSWFEWRAVAREAGLDRRNLDSWAAAVADALPQLVADAASLVPPDLQTPVVDRYVERTPTRSRQLMSQLSADRE